jgi:hypothetical protein
MALRLLSRIARADFEGAWRVFLSKRTEADQAWRDAPPTPKVDTPRLVKLKAAGLLAGLLIVAFTRRPAWLYFLARLGWDLAILKRWFRAPDRRHAGDQPPPSSRPIPSRQSRYASNATGGVQDNMMPKNTACKVVIGFRSLDVTFAQDKRFGPPSVAR